MRKPRRTITPQDVADELDCTLDTVYLGIKRGQIPAIKVSQRWHVLREPFEQLLDGMARPRTTFRSRR